MEIQIDFEKVRAKVKPMHAVGQPPFTGGFSKLDFSPIQILQDANIPFSRLPHKAAHVLLWSLSSLLSKHYTMLFPKKQAYFFLRFYVVKNHLTK